MTNPSTVPVLITGGAGYIGSHAVLALLDCGRAVVVLDDLSTGRRGPVPDGVPFYQGRINDDDCVTQVIKDHGCCEVMHFAGSIVVPESVAMPLDYYQNNVSGTAQLLRTCLNNGIERFVFSSSAAVYDGDYDVTGGVPLVEGAPLAPANPYGRSKLMTEWMLQDISAATDLRVAVLRYFNVAGADHLARSGQYSKVATHLIKRASQAALGVLPHIDVFGDDYPTPDGTCVRDYIHVSDLAQAHLAALDHVAASGENLTVNCGYGHGYSVREVLDATDKVLVDTLGIPALERRIGPRRAGDPPSLVADTTHMQSTLNWLPQFDDLAVMIETAIRWEKQLVDGQEQF